ncbi:MAG: hypothetical protein AABY83_13770 [Pseudomonadota bacterium]
MSKHLPAEVVRALPSYLNNPQAVLWDKIDPAVVYVFDLPGDDRHGKLIVRVNYKIKGRAESERFTMLTNSVRTGGAVPQYSLADKHHYEVIDGEL